MKLLLRASRARTGAAPERAIPQVLRNHEIGSPNSHGGTKPGLRPIAVVAGPGLVREDWESRIFPASDDMALCSRSRTLLN